MAAYGLYSHIQSNRRRSIALLIGLFFLVYVLVYAGALLAAALSLDADLDTLMRIAWVDFLNAAPFATLGAAAWIVVAYFFHQNMIDAVTGGREIQRSDDPRLYTILENLCISRGIPTPRLKVIESDALNAFATGMNAKQYSITVTTGLLDRLDDAEIESVLGHELTHIRNGDVRMMVVAVIIVGVISFFAELIFRLWFYNGLSFRGSRSDERRGRGAGIAILVAIGLLVVAYALLGSTWLIMKTEGALQRRMIELARPIALALLGVIAVVSIWTPFVHRDVAARWFTLPNLIFFAPVPILVLAATLGILHFLKRETHSAPFLLALALVFLGYSGLGISLWPHIIPPDITIRAAAGPPQSLGFTLVGALFIVPIILTYTAWSYYVFRGKVRVGEGYH